MATRARATPSPTSGSDVTGGSRPTGHLRSVELASGLGVIVLGAGLALVLPDWLRSYALPLLVVGVVVHGLGMSLKYRLERRDGPPLWWERTLFWLCWACLVGLVVWIAAAAIAVQP